MVGACIYIIVRRIKTNVFIQSNLKREQKIGMEMDPMLCGGVGGNRPKWHYNSYLCDIAIPRPTDHVNNKGEAIDRWVFIDLSVVKR